MILISVKSVFMDIKHQEETDKGAEKWLLKNKKLHDTYLAHHVSKKPLKPRGRDHRQLAKYESDLKAYNELLANCTMKVEIINTNANQLNLQIK